MPNISFYVPDKWFKKFWKPFLKTLPKKNRNISDAIRALVENSKPEVETK